MEKIAGKKRDERENEKCDEERMKERKEGKDGKHDEKRR